MIVSELAVSLLSHVILRLPALHQVREHAITRIALLLAPLSYARLTSLHKPLPDTTNVAGARTLAVDGHVKFDRSKTRKGHRRRRETLDVIGLVQRHVRSRNLISTELAGRLLQDPTSLHRCASPRQHIAL